MLTHADINLLDVVRLTDGREGTVLEIYDHPNLPIGYEIEICDKEGVTLDMFTITIDKIEKVVWKMPAQEGDLLK